MNTTKLFEIIEKERRNRHEGGLFGVAACKSSILSEVSRGEDLLNLLDTYVSRSVKDPFFNRAMVLACWELILHTTITVSVELTDEEIDDIVCAALEDGICGWCNEVVVLDQYGNEGVYLGEWAHEQISRGGSLRLLLSDSSPIIDRERLIFGIKLAATKGYAEGWLRGTRVDTYEVDAEAADIIFQFAVFGEIVYG